MYCKDVCCNHYKHGYIEGEQRSQQTEMSILHLAPEHIMVKLVNPKQCAAKIRQVQQLCSDYSSLTEEPKAEFKEFEPQLKFKPRLKYGWFHLKLYQIF